MVAKNLEKLNRYRLQIYEHVKTTKIYIALVKGDIKQTFGVIKLPLYFDEKNRRTYVDYKKGVPAYTEYIKLSTYRKEKDLFTLLMVKIKTGRTHQIRVHLNSIGHNILCDTKYEAMKTLPSSCNITPRLFLHAYYYKVDDNKDALACLPQDLQSALDNLKKEEVSYDFNDAFSILEANVITNIFTKKYNTKKNTNKTNYQNDTTSDTN